MEMLCGYYVSLIAIRHLCKTQPYRKKGTVSMTLTMRLTDDMGLTEIIAETELSIYYLTIFIRRVTLNIESDVVSLFVRHGQRTHFGVYPLVCPFSTWPGQGFCIELFLIGALNGLQIWQRSRAFLAQTSIYKGNVLCFFAEK